MVVFEIVESIEIAAPPEPVWRYRLDYTTLLEYNPYVSGLKRVDDGEELGVGAQYRFQVAMPGGAYESLLTVVEAAAARRIVNDIDASDGSAAREVVTLIPTERGTRLEIAMRVQPPDDVDTDTRAATIDGGRALLQLELDNIKRAVEGRRETKN
jgi:uncharacterized protein YndB with AHSA1/START domain